MSAAISYERAASLAALISRYPTPVRVVPDDERLYRAIDPMVLVAPVRFVGPVMVSMADTCRMRMRAYALRVWLARRLARTAVHAGLAAAWRGAAREDLYTFQLYTRALRQVR